MIVTRFRTDDEKLELVTDMQQQGRRVTYVAPFTSQGLSKSAVYTLLEKQELVMQNIFYLLSSLPLPGDGRIQLQKDLYLSMDEENGTVHFRKWWYSKKAQKLVPHKRGVAFNVDELQTIMDLLPDLYTLMV